jgi:hypothetical protein
MSHTPGPWTLDSCANGWSLLANGSDVTTEPFDCSDADARLIAAAPELLAALKMCKQALKNYIDSGYDEDEDQEAYAAAMAAIRTAERRE